MKEAVFNNACHFPKNNNLQDKKMSATTATRISTTAPTNNANLTNNNNPTNNVNLTNNNNPTNHSKPITENPHKYSVKTIYPTVKNVVIVGGGTSGWITAATLVKLLGHSIAITLIESEQIGTIGVGEATIPPIVTLNNALGISETDFMKKTQATIKLGIEFNHWGKPGQSYMHAFGNIGQDFAFCSFHHLWNKARLNGDTRSFWQYSLNYQAAKHHKFTHLTRIPHTELKGLVSAYHFDAGLYAGYLSNFCQQRGVQRKEGKVIGTTQQKDNGYIQTLHLESGETIEGDLFIDCTGFRGQLIHNTLGVAYENWQHWLPCDRAIAIPSERLKSLPPYTQANAHTAGWQWKIPLQHRTGNGIVYSDNHLSEDQAYAHLMAHLPSKPIAEPKALRFTTGRRKQAWFKNCIAIGLASGFLEPLESTSIHLVQSAAIRLVKHFPHRGIQDASVSIYNAQTQKEIEHIRDFLILHYHANQREGSDFWRDCQHMDIPDSLKMKIENFTSTGNIFTESDDLFLPIAWQQVMIGQNLLPKDYHPATGHFSSQQHQQLLDSLEQLIKSLAERLPDHEEFLNQLSPNSITAV
ncbi:tryptophan halogenase family protein [Marinibactrum halimedae]|uniref:Tryptophan halogenase n=1 Tax=Marinibactrum halimedae TaxID=1444977 RepID=A0AA37T1X0_9GAMM|nr:tryptophan halogenase family protein [Marinibactrum halimedae]MCD9459872.1 tryptophan 7-halogenase [Marinibactrum halimedae]GLS25274.1 tryptophan halogenase [Marinibactrum halimedae]